MHNNNNNLESIQLKFFKQYRSNSSDLDLTSVHEQFFAKFQPRVKLVKIAHDLRHFAKRNNPPKPQLQLETNERKERETQNENRTDFFKGHNGSCKADVKLQASEVLNTSPVLATKSPVNGDVRIDARSEQAISSIIGTGRLGHSSMQSTMNGFYDRPKPTKPAMNLPIKPILKGSTAKPIMKPSSSKVDTTISKATSNTNINKPKTISYEQYRKRKAMQAEGKLRPPNKDSTNVPTSSPVSNSTPSLPFSNSSLFSNSPSLSETTQPDPVLKSNETPTTLNNDNQMEPKVSTPITTLAKTPFATITVAKSIPLSPVLTNRESSAPSNAIKYHSSDPVKESPSPSKESTRGDSQTDVEPVLSLLGQDLPKLQTSSKVSKRSLYNEDTDDEDTLKIDESIQESTISMDIDSQKPVEHIEPSVPVIPKPTNNSLPLTPPLIPIHPKPENILPEIPPHVSIQPKKEDDPVSSSPVNVPVAPELQNAIEETPKPPISMVVKKEPVTIKTENKLNTVDGLLEQLEMESLWSDTDDQSSGETSENTSLQSKQTKEIPSIPSDQQSCTESAKSNTTEDALDTPTDTVATDLASDAEKDMDSTTEDNKTIDIISQNEVSETALEPSQSNQSPSNIPCCTASNETPYEAEAGENLFKQVTEAEEVTCQYNTAPALILPAASEVATEKTASEIPSPRYEAVQNDTADSPTAMDSTLQQDTNTNSASMDKDNAEKVEDVSKMSMPPLVSLNTSDVETNDTEQPPVKSPKSHTMEEVIDASIAEELSQKDDDDDDDEPILNVLRLESDQEDDENSNVGLINTIFEKSCSEAIDIMDATSSISTNKNESESVLQMPDVSDNAEQLASTSENAASGSGMDDNGLDLSTTKSTASNNDGATNAIIPTKKKAMVTNFHKRKPQNGTKKKNNYSKSGENKVSSDKLLQKQKTKPKNADDSAKKPKKSKHPSGGSDKSKSPKSVLSENKEHDGRQNTKTLSPKATVGSPDSTDTLTLKLTKTHDKNGKTWEVKDDSGNDAKTTDGSSPDIGEGRCKKC